MLHPELIEQLPFNDQRIAIHLNRRVEEVLAETAGLADPNVSVVIRACNRAEQLEELLEDLRAQDFAGEIETIVVDTESSDSTKSVAKNVGATVLNITQADFNYPRALNLGFQAASHPWVFSLVDHSLLTHDHTLKVASRWNECADVAAVYGTVLPNGNASKTELLGAAAFTPSFVKQPAKAGKPGMGFMAANALTVRREAWEEAGGFDEAYGAGGEDTALGREFLERGYQVMRDPAMSTFHSHGVGPIAMAQQFLYWAKVARPYAFSRDALEAFRQDLG